MKLMTRLFLFLVIPASVPSAARGQFTADYNLDLFGGSDSFSADEQPLDVIDSFSKLLSTDFSHLFYSTAHYSQSASLNTGDSENGLSVGLDYSASADYTVHSSQTIEQMLSGQSSVISTLKWQDRLTLVANGQGTVELPDYVTIKAHFHAKATADTYGDPLLFNSGFAHVRATLGDGLGESFVNVLAEVDHGGGYDESTFSGLITYDAVLGTGGFSNFFFSLQGSAATNYGKVTVTAGRTLYIESILMPDGTTPEANGFDVVLDSGVTSPNVTAAPEPASLALAALFSLVCLGRSARRHRRGGCA